jgi:cell wall-associated NlpC family hydrolase
MKKFTSILTLTLLIEASLIGNLHAARSAHRPWLAHNPEASLSGLESERTSLDAAAKARPMLRSRSKHRPILRVQSGSDKGEQIVQQAKRYRGARYRFGGDSKSKGFDCSGLVRRIYDDLNLESVPHTASGLYRMGTPVHMNELRPGDLVFFKNTYRHGISHVGVYAGDNHFIHARNRRHGVTITALSEPYYQLHYAGARRLY